MKTARFALAFLVLSVVEASQGIPGPRGTQTENGLAGYAKILCSGVFVSGRAPEDVVRGSAYFFMPQAEQDKVQWTIDRGAKLARASLGAITREARYYGDQGCIIQNPDTPGIHFKPVAVRTRLPNAATQAWPMGDRTDVTSTAVVNREKLDAAADAAFADPAAMTAAFLVVHKGQIVVERYAPGITRDTQLESWSMGKSLAATLFALLVKDGTYSLEQPAPVPLWQHPDDPRRAIRNIDLLPETYFAAGAGAAEHVGRALARPRDRADGSHARTGPGPRRDQYCVGTGDGGSSDHI
jgi:Beta-lactamase